MMYNEIYRNMMREPIFIGHAGGGLGCLWFVGWLFTIGYLKLSFGQGVLAIVVWPYYLGKKFHGHS